MWKTLAACGPSFQLNVKGGGSMSRGVRGTRGGLCMTYLPRKTGYVHWGCTIVAIAIGNRAEKEEGRRNGLLLLSGSRCRCAGRRERSSRTAKSGLDQKTDNDRRREGGTLTWSGPSEQQWPSFAPRSRTKLIMRITQGLGIVSVMMSREASTLAHSRRGTSAYRRVGRGGGERGGGRVVRSE